MIDRDAAKRFREILALFEKERDEQVTKKIFALFETLAHNRRMTQMSLLGKASIGEEVVIKTGGGKSGSTSEVVSIKPSARQAILRFLSSLDDGDFYARALCLQSCYGSQDSDRVVRFLNDRSDTLRRYARSLCVRYCTAQQIQVVLAGATVDERKKLLLALRQQERFSEIDAFITSVPENEQGILAPVLPFATEKIVERLFGTVEDCFSLSDWNKLSRIHPKLALAKLRTMAQAATCLDPRLLYIANKALQVVPSAESDLALDLVKDLLVHTSINQIHIHKLLRTRTKAICDLILSRQEQVQTDLTPFLHRLDEPAVLKILALSTDHSGYGRDSWLKRLAPQSRLAAFHLYADSWRDQMGCLVPQILALLPKELRIKEAQKHLRFEQLETIPHVRFRYAQLLPFAESMALLKESLSDPQPEIRAAAIEPLVSSVRFNRASAGELLVFLKSKANEPDPVRHAALSAMSALPPCIWRQEHLSDLGSVVRDALNAKDLSVGASLRALCALLVRIVPIHPDWACQWLATTLKERTCGYLIDRLPDRLNDRDVQALADKLSPVLKSWQTKERESNLISLARCFDRRLKGFTQLVAILENLAHRASSSSVSVSALQLLAHHATESFSTIVPRLLEGDPTWAHQYLVSEYLNRKRQDLLTPYLGQKAYTGKFATGKICVVPPYTTGFQRWTKLQRQIFGKALVRLTVGKDRSVSEIYLALFRISLLPEGPIETVIKFARAKEANTWPYAVQCLANADEGEGVPELIECLNDGRAFISVYALRQALLKMSPQEALQLLKNVPRTRVTVAKETIRLIGELKTDDAFEALLGFDKEELHRDVRIALLRALWSYLDRDAAWQVLERYSNTRESSIALHLLRIPADRLSAHAQERLIGLIATLMDGADPRVRLMALQRCYTMPVLDAKERLKESIMRCLESDLQNEYKAAAAALIGTYAARDSEVIRAGARRVIQKRRNLSCLASSLEWQSRMAQARMLSSVRAVIDELNGDDCAVGLQIRLGAAGLPWEEFIALVHLLFDDGKIHAGAVLQAVQAIEGAAYRTDAEQLHVVEDHFAKSDFDVLRRLGLAALCALCAGQRGWSPDRVQRLERFRKDRAALVAEAAQFTFPPTEAMQAVVL